MGARITTVRPLGPAARSKSPGIIYYVYTVYDNEPVQIL